MSRGWLAGFLLQLQGDRDAIGRPPCRYRGFHRAQAEVRQGWLVEGGFKGLLSQQINLDGRTGHVTRSVSGEEFALHVIYRTYHISLRSMKVPH